MKSFDVVGLGMATTDILTEVPRLPKSNDVFQVRSLDIQGGGPVATALVALAKLGAKAAYLGSVAPDDWGDRVLADFHRYGVNTEWTFRTETGESSLSIILVEEGLGHRSILYRKSSAPEITAKDLPIELLSSARVLHLDGFYLDAALESARIARSNGVLVSLDGSAGESIWAGMDKLLPLIDILVVARKFAQLVTGENNPLKAGPLLQNFGATQVVITDGENGCWYWDAKQHIFQPSFKVDVVDTTGAGDTFHGAYLFANLQGWAPGRCLCFASATAAIKCTNFGGRQGIPKYKQVLDFIESRG